MRALVLLLLLGSLAAQLQASSPGQQALQLIVEGVEPFDLGKSVPGVLEVDPRQADRLLTTAEGKTFGAVGHTTDGRVGAFAHGSFLKKGFWESTPEVKELVTNVIRWAGQSRNPSVGLAPEMAELEPILKELEMQVSVLHPDDLRHQVDVYCFIGQTALSPEAVEALKRFSLKGGGVIVSATPWPFKDRFPNFSRFPANEVAMLAGIRFRADGYATSRNGFEIAGGSAGIPVDDNSPMAGLTPVEAARELARARGRSDDRDTLIRILKQGAGLSGEDLEEFRTELTALNETIGPITPTREDPVIPGEDPLIDAIMVMETQFNSDLPAQMVQAIPAAADYPGEVPERAERVTRTLTLDGNWKGWISGRGAGAWAAAELRPTGLYAAPGELIRVTIPGNVAGEGFAVVIGAYRGGLDNRDKWHRYPRLQRRFPMEERVTEAANGFGGLINIAIPRNADVGDLEITIEGAVEAPLYVHGQTLVSEWKSTIREHPAPWAEIASDRMIIALPSDFIRDLDNPDEVMDVWNRIIDMSADLVLVDRGEYRAERIVFDRQTAAGSMHSGYPVAAHLTSAAQSVDADGLLSRGNWGFFHEYGHNHQHDLWALPGTGETTCNLWSVYLAEELVGIDRSKAHPAMAMLNRQQRINAYFNNGRKFAEEWSVWTALDAYLIIQEAFGWEPFQKVFHEYNELDQEDWPRTQQEKNDQWVIRFSRACGVNLAPYYRLWNLPLSDDVEEQIGDLPVWTDHPVQRFAER